MRRSTQVTLRRVVGTSAVVIAATVLPAAVAGAYPDNNPPPSVTVQGSSQTANQTPTVKAATQTSTLPFTGGDVAGLAFIGAGAALAGTVMVRRSRRRVNA